MEKIKNVLHPNKSTHEDTTNPPHTTHQHEPAHTHADDATLSALGSEPNVTGTDRPAPTSESAPHQHNEHQQEHKTPRAGHHHPRQPVGATGLPPNHKPRSDFEHGGGHEAGAAAAGAGSGAEGLAAAGRAREIAEADNNFPGTNPLR